jgi:hypothetical protein
VGIPVLGEVPVKISGTIYADPFSGIEMLLLRDGPKTHGLAYNPRRSTLPVPWSSTCPHCLKGRQLGLSSQVRREIRFLLSRQRETGRTRYELPSRCRPHVVHHYARKKKQEALVRGFTPIKTLLVTCVPRRPLAYEGDRRAFQSPILHRCLRLLFSGRPASLEEVAACLRPLALRPKKRRGRGGRILPCKKIDWADLYGRIS